MLKNEIFETLPDTGDDYDTAVAKFTEFFAPNKNAEIEIYKFRQAKQETGESILDPFHTRLSYRQLSLTCEFVENDKESKSQIIQRCNSTMIRRRALKEDMSLNDLLKLARSMEISDRQASEIEKSDGSTNDVNALTKRTNEPKVMEKKHKTPHHKDERPNDKCFFVEDHIFTGMEDAPHEVKHAINVISLITSLQCVNQRRNKMILLSQSNNSIQPPNTRATKY